MTKDEGVKHSLVNYLMRIMGDTYPGVDRQILRSHVIQALTSLSLALAITEAVDSTGCLTEYGVACQVVEL